jgi:Ni/Co efflux regulator RcnB
MTTLLQSLAAATLALSMGVGGVASAQPRGPDSDNGMSRWDGRQDSRGPRGDRDFRGERDQRDRDRGRPVWNDRDDRRGPPPVVYRDGPRDWRGHDLRNDRRPEWRSAGPGPRWHRGERLPSYYRSRQYVVDDWRGHRLSAPPAGYHWVQAGDEYVLAAIATGVILSVLLNN